MKFPLSCLAHTTQDSIRQLLSGAPHDSSSCACSGELSNTQPHAHTTPAKVLPLHRSPAGVHCSRQGAGGGKEGNWLLPCFPVPSQNHILSLTFHWNIMTYHCLPPLAWCVCVREREKSGGNLKCCSQPFA